MIPGFVYSRGDVVTDATLPIDNIKANVAVTTLAVAHTFSLFGFKLAALIVAPYSWAKLPVMLAIKASKSTVPGLMICDCGFLFCCMARLLQHLRS